MYQRSTCASQRAEKATRPLCHWRPDNALNTAKRGWQTASRASGAGTSRGCQRKPQIIQRWSRARRPKRGAPSRYSSHLNSAHESHQGGMRCDINSLWARVCPRNRDVKVCDGEVYCPASYRTPCGRAGHRPCWCSLAHSPSDARRSPSSWAHFSDL